MAREELGDWDVIGDGKRHSDVLVLQLESRVLDIVNYPDQHRHPNRELYVRCCGLGTSGVTYIVLEDVHKKMGLWK